MTYRSFRVAGLLAVTLGLGACEDYLVGPGLTENPNRPIVATPAQLLIAVQTQAFVRQQGQLARTAGIFTQQLSGINNQQRDWASYYGGTEQDYDFHFRGFYTGGGLVDILKLQAGAAEIGDAKFEGIGKVWEALVMGTAASIWGDIPYREAASDVLNPALDPQQQVYGDLQTLLDGAIADLGGAGAGPGAADLIYGGNVDRWRRAAYTLKARYHMHTGERLGAPAYQAALAAAQQGISEAPTTVAQAVHGQAPGDFRAFHDAPLQQSNIWSQFLGARQDIVAGNALLTVFNARPTDPRLAGYFDALGSGAYAGGDQFGRTGPAGGSVVDAETRRAPTFRQPMVTWAENQLIMAEANFRLGNTGPALTNVNNVRQALGMAALAGPITLNQIAEEKYIAMFQNIEVWNDYKRLCYPTLTPGGPNFTPAAEIPGRIPYGLNERDNNSNVPLPSQQPTRNWNDPTACQ